MIHFDFKRPNNEIPEGNITVKIDENSYEFFDKKQFPLRLMHKTLSGEVMWNTDLYPGWFSSYDMNTYSTVEIIDSIGNKLFEWEWNPFIHGDYAHQFFEIWSLNNIGSNGIAIGTHNGMTGEWVGPVNKGIVKATLVEASDIQFKDLMRHYDKKTWVTCLQSLITKNGGEVEFWEGDNGFTNSLSYDVISNYVSESSIRKVTKSSKSINDLIVECSEKGKVDWIHMDVEGLDGELIYGISPDLLPKLLIFESLHIPDDYYLNLNNYLSQNNYKIIKSGWNTLCVKNK